MEKKDYPGTFIVVEGPDGAGTTTQSKKLSEELDAFWTYEPAGNKIGEKVDEMISSEQYSPESIALAFAADRLVHLEEEIIPKLENGETVVCDRYYHSSLVYQPVLGADRGWVENLNREAVQPDFAFILDVSAEIGMSRVEDRGKDDNIFEDKDFQEKVVLGYRSLKDDLRGKVFLIDASKPKNSVFNEIKDKVPEP